MEGVGLEVTAADDDLLLEIDTVAVRVAVDVRDGERDLDILFVAVLLRVVLTVAVVVCPGRLRDVVAVAVLVNEIEPVPEIDGDALRLRLDEDERLFAAVGAIEGVGDDDGVTEGGDDGVAFWHDSCVDCHTPDPATVPTLPATAEFAVEVPVPSLNLACSSSDDGKGAAATLALHSGEYDAATSLAENARLQMRTSSMEVAV